MTLHTHESIKRQIKDHEEFQDELRKEIDRLPDGHERQTKINLLFTLHDEIAELHDQALRD